MTESKIIKNRSIPIQDFFANLQMEWISYRVRALLYTRAFDKSKFNSFCNQKKETILSVGKNKNFLNIFNSELQRIKYLTLFFNGNKTFPLFKYRDDYQKKIKGKWDIYYYYATTDLFTYTLTEELCKIILFDMLKNEATIEIHNNIVDVNLNELVRKFSDEFIKNIFNYDK